MEAEIKIVSSRVEPNRSHFAADGFVCLQNGGQRKVIIVATYYYPQKLRLEDDGEPQTVR